MVEKVFYFEYDIIYIICTFFQNYDSFINPGLRNNDEELRPISLITNVSVELGAYQVALEEVLTWLLEAEDHLAQHEQVPGNLEMLKDLFHAHEVNIIMVSLFSFYYYW